ncbi:thiamine phosphate synthase [Neisseria sp. Ec49-e6-T10]|uniref:thiamine phosphate synthase n=1 Tax=Neisseria sp. Ec49-e6-T10 TaxID=3140744 RepID=UPI003EC06E3F
MSDSIDLSLYLVLDPLMCGGFDGALKVAKAALEGGTSIIQLRAPDYKKRFWYDLALALKPICKAYHVPLIINDHIDIALAVDADGVHIGQEDLPAHIVRQLVGSDKIIGLSASFIEEVSQANSLPVDYVGIGPVFDTSSKIDANPALGFELSTQLVQACRLPNILIGGLKDEHIFQAKQTGTNGVAVISAICAAANPKKATQILKQNWINS